MITTIQNKQIKQIMKLKKNARERRKQQLFIVEGIRMFTEIPEQYLYKVYASEDFYKEHQAVFEGMEVELVSDQVMKEISDTMTPQGVLALVRMLEYWKICCSRTIHYCWFLRICKTRGILVRSFVRERELESMESL